MKVFELIEQLKRMPAYAEVNMHLDGISIIAAEAVWLTQRGNVSIGEIYDSVYNDEDRIAGATLSANDPKLSVSEMLGLEHEED